ncbi:carbohydrate-binding protein [Xylanimonas allomyrinae]|uniref:Carbohydrate-binding protein n=1 Tax=Xylanimonas allomyrinae TaxID=2509459 RepID=A0A4P6ESG2_9MICO|nr:carbohydrate-binding protein [Xylanimonas allomyrinae]
MRAIPTARLVLGLTAAVALTAAVGAPVASGAPSSPHDVNVVVPYGQTAQLPAQVVVSDDGTPVTHAVRWPALDPGIFTDPGTHTVTGEVTDTGASVTGVVTVGARNQTLSVAAVGDSITYGMNTSGTETSSYPAQLQSMLGDAFSVKNFGISGYTVMTRGDLPYARTTQYTQSRALNPDVVVFQLGTNDTKSWNYRYISDFVDDYRALVRSYLSLPSAPVVFVALPPTVFSTAYGIDETNLLDVNKRILDAMSTPEFQDVTIIDNHTFTADSKALYGDGVHPGNEGSTELAVNVRTQLVGDTRAAHSRKTMVTSLTDEKGAYLYGSNDRSGLPALRSVNAGDWVSFSNVTLDPGPSPAIHVRLAVPYDNTTLTIRAGSPTGTVLAAVKVAQTGGLASWKTVPITLADVGTGPRTSTCRSTGRPRRRRSSSRRSSGSTSPPVRCLRTRPAGRPSAPRRPPWPRSPATCWRSPVSGATCAPPTTTPPTCSSATSARATSRPRSPWRTGPPPTRPAPASWSTSTTTPTSRSCAATTARPACGSSTRPTAAWPSGRFPTRARGR